MTLYQTPLRHGHGMVAQIVSSRQMNWHTKQSTNALLRVHFSIYIFLQMWW